MWVPHSKILERHFDGTAVLDLDDAVGGSPVMLGIVTEASINADTNSLYSGLTPVAASTGWTGPVALANMTCDLDGSFDLVFDFDDPAQIAADGGGFANGRALVLYRSDDSHILESYVHAQAFGNINGPINVTIDAAGALKLTI